MPTILDAYHGTIPGAPLVGGQDPVSPHTLACLWASNSYYLAAQFQDGEVRRLRVALHNPLVIDCGGKSMPHACIVRQAHQDRLLGHTTHDGVIFLDTIDGMECGDVVAVFGVDTPTGWSVDHAARVVGRRAYDDSSDAWVSDAGFPDNPDTIPQTTSWAVPAPLPAGAAARALAHREI